MGASQSQRSHEPADNQGTIPPWYTSIMPNLFNAGQASTGVLATRSPPQRKTPPLHPTPVSPVIESDGFDIRLTISMLQDYLNFGDKPVNSSWTIEDFNTDVILEVLRYYVASQTDGVFILMLVSNAWRDFVLASPVLWQWITVDEGSPDWLEKAMVCASMAASYPLQVVVRLPFKEWDHLVALLPRIRNIVFEFPYHMTGSDVREETSWFLANANLPTECQLHWYHIGKDFLKESRNPLSLEIGEVIDITLWADGSEHPRYRRYAETGGLQHLESGDEFNPRLLLKVFHILEIFRNAANLRTLTLSHYAVDPISSDIHLPVVALPALQSLQIVDIDHRRNGTLLFLVESLQLPGLSTISLAGEFADILEIVGSLLDRSSPSALSLCINGCSVPPPPILWHNRLASIISMRFQVENSLERINRKFEPMQVIGSLVQTASGLLHARFALSMFWYMEGEVFPIIRAVQWQNIRSLVFLLMESLDYEHTVLEYAFFPTLAKTSVSGFSILISWTTPYYGPCLTVTTLEIEIKNGGSVEGTLHLEESVRNRRGDRVIGEYPPVQLVESAVRCAPQVTHFRVVLPLEWNHQDFASNVSFETQWHNVKTFVLAVRGSSGIITILEATFSPTLSKSSSAGTKIKIRIKDDRDVHIPSFAVLQSRGSRSPYLGIATDFVRRLVELFLQSASKQLHFLFVFPLEWYEQDEISELLLATQWHTFSSLTLAVEESSEEVTVLDYSFSPTSSEASLSGVHTMVWRFLEKLVSKAVATSVEIQIHRNIVQESLPMDFFNAYNGSVSKSLKSFSIHILDWSFEHPEVEPILEKLHSCVLWLFDVNFKRIYVPPDWLAGSKDLDSAGAASLDLATITLLSTNRSLISKKVLMPGRPLQNTESAAHAPTPSFLADSDDEYYGIQSDEDEDLDDPEENSVTSE